MDSANTTWFLACMLLISVVMTPFAGADPAPGGGADPATTAAAGAGAGAGATPSAGAGAGATPSAGAGAPTAGATPSAGATTATAGATPSAGAGSPTAGGTTSAGAGAPTAGATPSAGAGAPTATAGATPSAGAGAPTATAGATPSAGAGAPTATAGATPSAGAGAPTATAGAMPSAGAGAPTAGATPSAAAPGAGTGAAPGGAPIVPCYFIFGDSLADSGNNNELKSLAHANYLPYGVDYPAGPTGRFTNGRTYVDFIAEYLGFPNHIPPYAAAKSSPRILQGVNYASGSAGIRPETGKIVGDRIPLDQQLQNHIQTLGYIKEQKGNNEVAARDLLGKCLYTVNIGSNDYMVNYLITPANPKDVVYTPDAWADDLSKRLTAFLKAIHGLGARKVAVYGLGPIGCEPSQVKPLRMAGKQGCVEAVNDMVNLYSKRLPPIIDDINKSLPDAKFIFVNQSHIYEAKIDVKVDDQPCCPTEPVAGSCTRGSTPCANRGDYSFFDNYHPTEKAVLPGAQRAWKALEPQDTYPMDISRLARL